MASLFKDLVAADTHQRAALGNDKRKKKAQGEMVAMKFDKAAVVKVDEALGLVFGFAIVSKQDGEDYYDLQDDHIPEDAMLKAATDFMENSRVAKEMHAGDEAGTIVFAFPLTTDIAKALDIVTKRTGLLIAMRPADGMLAKFKSGEFTGFSIGGYRITDEAA